MTILIFLFINLELESSELKRVRSETFGPSIVQETPPPKPILTEEAVSKWSVEDVAKWLKDKNCDSEIIERLKKEKVDGEVFCIQLKNQKILFYLIVFFFISMFGFI